MTQPEVLIARTGVANLASVVAGFQRLCATVRLGESAHDIATAARVVLPGVGAFGAGMRRLHETGVAEALRERIAAGRPTLAVCLGLQLLCESSEETPGVPGLGVVPGHVTRFSSGLRVPQIGWNRIVPDDGCRFVQPGHAYFANSFRLPAAPTGWRAALADYDGPFVAALERGAVLACQFHPELSSDWGMALLGRWLTAAENGGGDAGA